MHTHTHTPLTFSHTQTHTDNLPFCCHFYCLVKTFFRFANCISVAGHFDSATPSPPVPPTQTPCLSTLLNQADNVCVCLCVWLALSAPPPASSRPYLLLLQSAFNKINSLKKKAASFLFWLSKSNKHTRSYPTNFHSAPPPPHYTLSCTFTTPFISHLLPCLVFIFCSFDDCLLKIVQNAQRNHKQRRGVSIFVLPRPPPLVLNLLLMPESQQQRWHLLKSEKI